MNEDNQAINIMPDVPEPTAEEIAGWEAQRKADEEALLAPARAEAAKLKEIEVLTAEHDEAILDLLYTQAQAELAAQEG
ncbi:MAG: hypothetical protein LLF96_07430 [Eubacteriales bacterium]|nr:hypothetical protein [Eubacteriales bacterium]